MSGLGRRWNGLRGRWNGLRGRWAPLLLLLVAALSCRVEIARAADPAADPEEAAVLREAAGRKAGKVPRVPWVTGVSWAGIVARAAAEDRPVLIDFTATWCGPCKLLDVMVFTEKAVIAELAEVITFQVDIDNPEYRDLKTQFGVTAVPTIAWCDSRGNLVDSFSGYVSSREFLEIVRGWRNNRTIDRVLDLRQAASPQDPDVLLGLARRQAERGRDREAEVLYRRLLNLRHDAPAGTVAHGMLGLAAVEDRAGRPAEARRLAARVALLYAVPDSATSDSATSDSAGAGRAPADIRPTDPAAAATVRNEMLLEAALFQEAIGDTLGMLASFRTLAARDSRSVLALHGYARAAVKAGQDLVGATKAALRATVYSDDDPDVISTLAACYFQRGMVSRAIRWQEKAVAAAPHTPRYAEELARYRAALADDPAGVGRSRRSGRPGR